MVEIFQTNVKDKTEANLIILLLSSYFPDFKTNFDLEDCDKILRIESQEIISGDVERILVKAGFQCKVLS